jgi:hypothetical protein
MQYLRQTWLIGLIGLIGLSGACGEKDEMTASTSSSTTTPDSSSSSDADPTTTAEPTTSGTSTGDGTTSTSTSGAESSSGEPLPCETSPSDCGVSESDVDSFCTEPIPEGDMLFLESPGPGQLKITEIGYDQSCNVKVLPIVKIGPNNSLVVSYEIQGNPDAGCICKFTITTTLGNLPSGKWNVYLGPFQQSIDVL